MPIVDIPFLRFYARSLSQSPDLWHLSSSWLFSKYARQLPNESGATITLHGWKRLAQRREYMAMVIITTDHDDGGRTYSSVGKWFGVRCVIGQKPHMTSFPPKFGLSSNYSNPIAVFLKWLRTVQPAMRYPGYSIKSAFHTSLHSAYIQSHLVCMSSGTQRTSVR